MQEFLQYLFSGMTSGAVYAAIAIGFSLLFMTTELINFAHGEFVMIGALVMVSLTVSAGIPVFLAFMATIAIVAAVGIIFERLAIRTVKKPEPIVLIIITVGASIFLKGIGMLLWGKDAHSMPPFSQHPPIDIAGARLIAQSIWILAIILFFSAGLFIFFKKTLVGKAMEACSESRKGATIIGIPYKSMITLAFGISTAMGGVAGAVIAPITMSSYDMGTLLGLKGFCAAMLGGLGSLWGAIAGGFILGILEAMGVGYINSGLKDATAFLLLLLILYARPTGIFGRAGVERF